MAFPVIYLTGAPAAGKTTLVSRLSERVPNLLVFQYGQELTKFLRRKSGADLSQDDLRAKSSLLATEEDINSLDTELIRIVGEARIDRPVLIDTHAVTKEAYGFRISPFSAGRLRELNPTRIVMLYASPEATIERITANPGGRPMVTGFESELHTSLQASVAITYAIDLGLPVHLLDSAKGLEFLVEWMEPRMTAR